MYQIDSILRLLKVQSVGDMNTLLGYFLTDPSSVTNVSKKMELIPKIQVVTAVKV
jgi:hypothetical protein